METKERIEILRWLVGRSDSMRATYSNRAALILSADAIILAAIAFLLEKYIAGGELWVDLQLQQIRYARLKTSVWFIFGAFVSLVVALIIAVLR